MQITDPRTGKTASVGDSNRLDVSSRSNERIYYASRLGDAYMINCVDAGPVAAEYTLWIKNNSDGNLIVQDIYSWATDADVVWKLWQVTGTGTTASAIVPVNLNISSAKIADVTCLGGAGAVGGLTTVNTPIIHWYQGPANTPFSFGTNDTLIIGPGQAIAIEYDAGTGGAVMLKLKMFFDID